MLLASTRQADGRIKPLNSAFVDLRDAPEAMIAMQSRKVRGKVLVVTPEFRRRYGETARL